MRVFDEFPDRSICPICGTNKKGKCVLIGVEGTQEGRNIEAQPFHLECIELLVRYSKPVDREIGYIGMGFMKKEGVKDENK